MIKNNIKKLWLCLACMLSVAYVSAQKAGLMSPFMASHYGVTIQGACIYSESWNNLPEGEFTPMGIYQMEQSSGYEIKPFLINSAVYSNGGGAFIGNNFWFVWMQRDPSGQFTLCQREKFDLTTGKRENLGTCTNDLMATSAGTAVDPTTGDVYGIFWDSESMTSRQLGIIDYPNGTRTTIATISQALYALCCDKTGQLYAVTQSGKLVKVDKTDGMLTEVGNTGIKPSMMQAAAIDLYTNKMYWTAIYKNSNGKYEAGLYEVDLATAQATKLASYPNLDEFSALRILAPKAKDDAPAPATDLTAAFNNAETSGTFSFRLPTESFAGTAISGELSYNVSIDGESKATGKAAAGKEVKVDVSTSTGMHSFFCCSQQRCGRRPYCLYQQIYGLRQTTGANRRETVYRRGKQQGSSVVVCSCNGRERRIYRYGKSDIQHRAPSRRKGTEQYQFNIYRRRADANHGNDVQLRRDGRKPLPQGQGCNFQCRDVRQRIRGAMDGEV